MSWGGAFPTSKFLRRIRRIREILPAAKVIECKAKRKGALSVGSPRIGRCVRMMAVW